MALKGVYIYEFPQKIDILCEALAAAHKIENTSRQNWPTC